jgi:hypothetical protein
MKANIIASIVLIAIALVIIKMPTKTNQKVYVGQFVECMQIIRDNNSEITPKHIESCDEASKRQAQAR